MSSITKLVKQDFETAESTFKCPVAFGTKLCEQLNKIKNLKQTISVMKEAANAVELVGRFERNVNYVDFFVSKDTAEMTGIRSLRVSLKKGREHIALIELSKTEQVVSAYG